MQSKDFHVATIARQLVPCGSPACTSRLKQRLRETEIGCGNQVDCADKFWVTPLHSAAAGGHVGTIQKLVALGHNVESADYMGELSSDSVHLRAIVAEAQSWQQQEASVRLNCSLPLPCWWQLVQSHGVHRLHGKFTALIIELAILPPSLGVIPVWQRRVQGVAGLHAKDACSWPLHDWMKPSS